MEPHNDRQLKTETDSDGGYGDAGAVAMNGDWRPTSAVFRRMLAESLEE